MFGRDQDDPPLTPPREPGPRMRGRVGPQLPRVNWYVGVPWFVLFVMMLGWVCWWLLWWTVQLLALPLGWLLRKLDRTVDPVVRKMLLPASVKTAWQHARSNVIRFPYSRRR